MKVAPCGLSRHPIALGPTRCGDFPKNVFPVLIWKGNASKVSITDRSSAACTIGHVAFIAKSRCPFGGLLRLSSVKKENMPPPSLMFGNAARVARYRAGRGGAGGLLPPGRTDLRSPTGQTATASSDKPARFTKRATPSSSPLKPLILFTTISRTILAFVASAIVL